jgi:hypothetical protein
VLTAQGTKGPLAQGPETEDLGLETEHGIRQTNRRTEVGEVVDFAIPALAPPAVAPPRTRMRPSPSSWAHGRAVVPRPPEQPR